MAADDIAEWAKEHGLDLGLDEEEELEPLDPSLEELVRQDSLRWIFVGGKGGVGKTTTSCSLAVTLAARRESVLIVSTDPAHNTSDAFGQKFSREPTKVSGFDNLYCMEIDAAAAADTGRTVAEDLEADEADDSASAGGLGNLFGKSGPLRSMLENLTQNIPGIDEAMGFAQMMKSVLRMEFSVIVFDTAPTGHTLRMLSFPSMLERGISQLQGIQGQLSGLLGPLMSMMGGGADGEDSPAQALTERLSSLKHVVSLVKTQFEDPDLTQFVCVCIPEFLSLYETERLVQELGRSGMDVQHIVVNQVLLVPDDADCRTCLARSRMQGKYLRQIQELYEGFHVVRVPLLLQEVRGIDYLRLYGSFLIRPVSSVGDVAERAAEMGIEPQAATAGD